MPVPQSYIKNIAIRLSSDFEMENTPLIEDQNENGADGYSPEIFIGRKNLQEKFKAFLYSKTKRGVFLVTGYRGMGKTSFVNRVMRNYKNFEFADEPAKRTDKKIETISLTLAQNNLSEFDILRMIAVSIFDKYTKRHEKKIAKEKAEKRNFPFYIFYTLIPFLLLYFLFFKADILADFIANSCGFKITVTEGLNILKWFGYTVFFAGGATLIFLIDNYRINLKKGSENSSLKRIRWLVERCHAAISEEHNDNKEVNISGVKTAFGLFPKRTKAYPIASVKEIEYELKEFLKDVFQKEGLEFIFIFDELDKIESAAGFQYIHEELDKHEAGSRDNDYFTQLRNRKETVINVIASLKNFFTSADARFVFIAGREIFDASLADIADKQSSINSIFTYIFNIESWLKDDGLVNPRSSPSLSTSIEDYLKHLIFPKKTVDGTKDIKLFDMLAAGHGYLQAANEVEYHKLYFMLQAFVTYLVYRSNGSPKKLKKAIHDFILIVNSDNEDTFSEARADGKLFIINPITQQQETECVKGKYIYFNYLNQYRIGFINYLYRPFLLQKGRSFKMYSDNTNIAIPYLFDHLLKFHSYAFSFSNLELVPEILSASKTPYLKQHMGEIVNYLKGNHIRETDIELFDYKFYSRTQNEIIFLSKVFEEEAAAFNFTLDESYPVKMLVNNKIKELRSIYAKFQSSSDTKNQQIFSIAYLNGNLGDLHFFDQEFDSAIGCYSDAIRPINNIEVEKMNLRDFITLTRNKLKIGLCFEKINSYEEALAFYSDASQDAKRFISFRINNSIAIKEETAFQYLHHSRNSQENNVYLSSSLNDLLQIVIQCFLAKIVLQEKMGLEGITTPKVQIAVGGFLTLAANVGLHCGTNSLITANAFLHLGNILYYKNSSERTSNASNINVHFPKEIENKINRLQKNRGNFLDTDQAFKRLNKREPLLAFQMYLIGLDGVMQTRRAFRNLCCDSDGDIIDIYSTKTKYDLLSNYPRYNVLPVYFKSLDSYLNLDEPGNSGSNELLLGPHLRYIATFLSSIGDSILAMHKTTAANGKKIDLGNYKSLTVEDLFDTTGIKSTRQQYGVNAFYKLILPNDAALDGFTIMDVLRCYYLSGMFFKKYGRTASCGFQFKKILHVLRIVLDGNKQNNDDFLDLLENCIVDPVKEISLQNIGNTHSHILNKAKQKISAGDNNQLDNFLSNHTDFKEAALTFACIKMKLKQHDGSKATADDMKRLISSYNMYSTQYSRILELDLHSKYIETFVNEPGNDGAVGCIFSLMSILRLLAIDGQDFMISSSYVAYVHYRLAKFIEKNVLPENEQTIKDDIEKLLGEGAYSALDKDYHYAMAKDNYEKSMQLHTAGKEYKKTINDMIYLEDDFNDNAYHFGAAIDRYLMVNGVFSHYIEKCDCALAPKK